MKRAVAVLLCAVLAIGSITSCQSKKSETAASSSVKEEKETKTDKDNENEKDDTSKNDSKGCREYGKSRECINRHQNRYKIRR